MSKNQKEVSPLLFQLVYAQISKHTSYSSMNIAFMLLQFALILCKMYDLIDPQFITSLNLPYLSIFFILTGFIAFFILLTIISYQLSMFNSIWTYGLFLMESLQIIYVEITIRCIMNDGWNSDSNIKISCLLMFAIYAVIIYIRSHCYYPFYDCKDPLSMNSGSSIIYIFLYCMLISLATSSLMPNIEISKQAVFFLTCGLYSLILSPPYSNPTLSRLFAVCSIAILWTSTLIYVGPLIQTILNGDQNATTIWYYWGFSFPVVVGLSFMQTRKFAKWSEWREIFFDTKVSNIKELYLQCNQLIKIMDVVIKSQLRANSQQFKQLWELIGNHNKKCTSVECPLTVVSSLLIERGDELIQQKRFSKTVQKTLEFAHQKLSMKKDMYPNSIELNIQIAHYQLEVFHQRTKGFQLYNREYFKPERTKEELWGIFYLKRKIEGFEVSGEMKIKGETEDQIISFKHDIEVSVSMLAQFWYFLADPKCNLKKLYDLANILFPMKIRVDKTWKNVRLNKNIQCFHLYAKYLIKMFNDKQKGLKILEEARKLQSESNEKEQILNGGESNMNEEHGVIFLEFDGKNSGIMYQVNTACEKIFGYNKGELQGRKVNDIMPKVFSIFHDRILENYQQTNRPKMLNKERSIWGKSKDGYLFPFTICIKPVRNYYSQTSEVFASVKRDLWVREIAFIFTDPDFLISDVSASLLGLFPDLHGRLHLKKKIPLTEIIPDFMSNKQKILAHKQSHELNISRSFSIGNDQQYTQNLLFTIMGEEVSIAVCGLIGYYFKIIKGTGYTAPIVNNQTSNLALKEANMDCSNTYWMKRENQFAFIATLEDQSQNMKMMNYHGGVLKETNETKTLILSRIQNSFEMTKQQNKLNSAIEKIQYGKDIKVKRLQGSIIRQIHELSEQSENNGMMGDNEQEEQELVDVIKPSQLNSILQRENGNKNIYLLKILTIVILLLASLLAIFQYIITNSYNSSIVNQLQQIVYQSSLESSIMYINTFASKFQLKTIQPMDIPVMLEEINELDNFVFSIPLTIFSNVVYSDGASQSIILSFAANKLISESQLLAANTMVQSNSPHLFFVTYNSVNGLELGCELTLSQSQQILLGYNSLRLQNYYIFLGAGAAAFLVILIVKNLIIRSVLKKKGQILNVFFEIPRYACNQIQKECERFIQKLNMDDNDELQVDFQSDQEQQSSKKYGKHKKRTIMGEEKTSSNFILVSLMLLIFMIVYPILVIALERVNESTQQFTFNTLSDAFQLQKQFAKMMSFIDTNYAYPNYSLMQSNNPKGIINRQYANLTALFLSLQQNNYFIGNIFDQQYVNEYNRLFFSNLCTNSLSCLASYGEDKGLNTLMFYYYDYVISKYQLFQDSANLSVSDAFPPAIIQKEEKLRLLMKKYWRQFQTILLNGSSRFVMLNDSLLFGIMLSICIINMTFLLWGWIQFYNSLEQKIIATEYILTFIPIDEINKNPKIVKYIKDQILRIH